MTHFLSQALGAPEPRFSQSLQQLEHAAGRPSADIRLTTDISAKLRTKIVALGLDPADTTGPELYSALHQRLAQDETTVREVLKIPSEATADEIVQRVTQFLETHED